MARRILKDTKENRETLRFWIGSSNNPAASSFAVQWNGQHYVYMTAKGVEDLVWDVLETAYHLVEDEDTHERELVPWPQTTGAVSAITSAMHGVAKMRSGITPNSWIGLHANGLVIPCSNKLLVVSDFTTVDHTDEFFNLSCLPYEYDPDASCPMWEKAVSEWMSGDQQSIEFLQEWVGYLVSGRTDLQVMFLGLGPKRAGKGTLVRVLTALLGIAAVGSMRMTDLVGERSRFSLSNNIHRSLIVFPDVRQLESNEGKAFVQFALNITGEDDIQVDVKNKTPWTGRLPARLMSMSNEMPTIPDASGAMAIRIIVVEFNKSWAGKEDPHLTSNLKKELAGILNWALKGLVRLQERGRFVQPEISAHKKHEIDDVSNPIRNFIDECVYADIDVRTSSELAYRAWESFCSRCGERPNTDRWFRKHLAAAMQDKFPEVNYRYDRIDGSDVEHRPYYLFGVGLKGHKTESRVISKGKKNERIVQITTPERGRPGEPGKSVKVF
jgi:putative DNA primase/helicase